MLTANYAIYYENRKLWEAKGNVVVVKSDGKNLYTQQLFWNQQTKKIYSNVDSKIVQNDGRDVFIGEGFESDEEFKDWRFTPYERPHGGRGQTHRTGGRGRSRFDCRRPDRGVGTCPCAAVQQNRRCIRRRAYARTAVKPAVAPVPVRRPVRRDAPGRPASAGEPAEARPRTEQQHEAGGSETDDDEIQSTQ
ncbi:MAG: hypothetical protein ACLU18_13125 [Bacteroides thetaiotaomicron]